jgi:hypothetical protein
MLITVLENQDVWQRMSRAAIKRYQARFSPELLGPKWVSAITADLPPAVPEPVAQTSIAMQTT